MATALIGTLFVLMMVCVALRANKRLQGEGRLPMQWLLPDEVVLSASRPAALAFVPGLAFLSFAGLTVLSIYTRPRPGQEGLLIPAMVAIGFVFLGTQIFHLWMVKRTLRRKGS